MTSDEIVIPLQVKEDKHGSKYLLGFPRLRANIDLSEFAFFVFYSEEGAETMVIRPRIQREGKTDNKEPEIFRQNKVDD